jgi:hypothetical protein
MSINSLSDRPQCVEASDQEQREDIANSVDWCVLNQLCINASGTEETLMDFGRKASQITLRRIQRLDTETETTHTLLVFTSTINWTGPTVQRFCRRRAGVASLVEEPEGLWCVRGIAEVSL